MLTEAEKLEIAREAMGRKAEANYGTVAGDCYRNGLNDHWPDVRDCLRALTLADQRRGGGDDVWVPREPTPEMVQAGGEACQAQCDLTMEAATAAYRAMIAAAPASRQGEGQDQGAA